MRSVNKMQLIIKILKQRWEHLMAIFTAQQITISIMHVLLALLFLLFREERIKYLRSILTFCLYQEQTINNYTNKNVCKYLKLSLC